MMNGTLFVMRPRALNGANKRGSFEAVVGRRDWAFLRGRLRGGGIGAGSPDDVVWAPMLCLNQPAGNTEICDPFRSIVFARIDHRLGNRTQPSNK
jgi:hypothetical protein